MPNPVAERFCAARWVAADIPALDIKLLSVGSTGTIKHDTIRGEDHMLEAKPYRMMIDHPAGYLYTKRVRDKINY